MPAIHLDALTLTASEVAATVMQLEGEACS